MRIKQFSLSFVSSIDHSETYDAIIQLNPKGTYSYIYYSIFPENGAIPHEGMVCNTIHTSPYFKVPNISPFDNYFIVLYEIDAYTQQPLQRIWEMFYSEFTSPFISSFISSFNSSSNSTSNSSFSSTFNSSSISYCKHHNCKHNNCKYDVSLVGPSLNLNTTNEMDETIDELLAELDSIVIDCDKKPIELPTEPPIKPPKIIYVLEDYFQEDYFQNNNNELSYDLFDEKSN